MMLKNLWSIKFLFLLEHAVGWWARNVCPNCLLYKYW